MDQKEFDNQNLTNLPSNDELANMAKDSMNSSIPQTGGLPIGQSPISYHNNIQNNTLPNNLESNEDVVIIVEDDNMNIQSNIEEIPVQIPVVESNNFQPKVENILPQQQANLSVEGNTISQPINNIPIQQPIITPALENIQPEKGSVDINTEIPVAVQSDTSVETVVPIAASVVTQDIETQNNNNAPIEQNNIFNIETPKPTNENINFNAHPNEPTKQFNLVLFILMVLGVGLLIFGITNTIKMKTDYKNYKEVMGKFDESVLASSDRDERTYYLIYKYVVDGFTYRIKTDYSTSIVPKEGTEKSIKYDTTNPSVAVFNDGSNSLVFIFVGFMFAFIPLVFLFSDYKKTKKINEFLVPVIFICFGIGIYYLLGITSKSFSPIDMFMQNGLFLLFPILFGGVGVYALYNQLFGKTKKNIENNNQPIEEYSAEDYAKAEKFVNNVEDGVLNFKNKFKKILIGLISLFFGIFILFALLEGSWFVAAIALASAIITIMGILKK